MSASRRRSSATWQRSRADPKPCSIISMPICPRLISRSAANSRERAMAEVTLVEAVNLALARAMEDDPDVVVLGEDVGINGGVFGATVGLQTRFGPERFLDTPLAELLCSGRAYGLLLAAIRDPDPVVFLEPTRIYRAAKGEVEDNGEASPLDVAFVLREGRDVTLISWGAMLKETMAAADALAAEGIGAEVIDLATLKPYDEVTVLGSVAKTGRCVIVHEATRTGGFGAEIAALIAERGLTSLLAPVARVTGYDTVIPMARLEQKFMPSVGRIVAAAHKACQFN